MSVCCWLFLLKLFATTDSSHNIILSKPQVKDRKVNLELETVLEFNNKDNAADIHFLNNIQDFIGKVKKVINKKNDLRRDFSSGRLEKFTDFIHNIINILYKFEDDDLEYFFAIVSDEIRKYHYRGCKFHELAENYGLRKFVINGLDALKNIPARSIRKKILAVAEKIEEEKYENNEKELVHFINSLYRQNSVEKFRKILISFDDYRLNARHGNISLVKIIREGIRSIIFDHYTELNHNARQALKSKMEEYFKYLMDLSNTLVSQLNAEKIRLRSHNEDSDVEATKDSRRFKKKAHKTKTSKHIEYATDVTVTKTTNIYIDLNNYMQVKYETPYYEYTTEGMTEFKKMTFMTLYPKFVEFPTKFRSAVNSPDAGKTKKKIILKEERDRKSPVDRKPRAYEPVTEEDFKKAHRKRTKITPTTKEDKEKRTMRQIYVERNVAVKSNPNTRNKLTTTKHRQSKLTFMTLYPEFDESTVTKKPLKVKKLFSPVPVENTMQTLWYEEMKKPHQNILREKYSKAVLSTDKGVLEVVTMKPFATRKVVATKKLKYEVKLGAFDIQRNDSELVMKKPEFAVATFRTIHSDSKLKNKLLRHIDKVKQAAIDLSNGKIKSEKDIPTNSVKRFVEELIDRKHRRSYGKDLPNIPKDSVIVDKHILTRLQELEEELKRVNTRILNDSETVMDLNKKVLRKANNHNDHKRTHKYNTEEPNLVRETKPNEEVVFDLAAQIKLNDGRLSSKLTSKEKAASDLIEWKKYLKRLQNTVNQANKKYSSINNEFQRSILNGDKEEYIRDHLFDIDKEISRGTIQTTNKNTNIENWEQNDEINMINKKYIGDNKYGNQYKIDHENYKNTSKKKFKQRFDLKSFTDEKTDTHSKKKSEKAYDFDRNAVKTNLYENKFHGKTNNEDFNNIKKIQAKEREYVKSGIHKLDDINNNDHYQMKSDIIQNMDKKYIKHRFSIKSYSDNKISPHSNKMNEKKYNIESSSFDRDKYRYPNREIVNHFESNANNKVKDRELEYDRNTINRHDGNNGNQCKHNLNTNTEANQKYLKHRFQLSSFREDKNNSYPNQIDERKYDFNKTTFNNDKHHNMDKSNQIGLTFIDVNEYRKQQERKYYPSSKKNDLDGSNTNRQRIYEPDSSKPKYVNNSNHLESDAQIQIDGRINKLNEERDMESNRIPTHDNHITHISNTNWPKSYHESTGDHKMHTIDTVSHDRKLIQANEFGYGVTMNIIQKDLRNDGRSEIKSIGQELHNNQISPWTENYESINTDNNLLHMSKIEKQHSKLNNEREIYSGSYSNISVGDIKSKTNSEKNKFIIIDEYTGDPIKDVSKLHDSQSKLDREHNADIIRNNVVKVNGLEKYKYHDASEMDIKKINKIEFDANKGNNKEEPIIIKENNTRGKYDFGGDEIPTGISHKKNDVVFKSVTKKDASTRFMGQKVSSKPTSQQTMVSLHEPLPKLVEDFEKKYYADSVQDNVDKTKDLDKIKFYKETNREEYGLDKDGNKKVLLFKEINSTNGKLKYDDGKKLRSDISHEKSDVVFKSDIKKDVNMEHNHYTKQTKNTVSLQDLDAKLDGEYENKYDTTKVSGNALKTNDIDKNSFHEGNAALYDPIKNNNIKYDLDKSHFKTETLSKEKDGKLNNGSKLTDHKKNDFVFKPNTDKDVLDKYLELNYYNANNETDAILKERTTDNVQINNYLGGGVNQHSQTTQYMHDISNDKLNNSLHSSLPKDVDKHSQAVHEDDYFEEKSKSTTVRLNSTKEKSSDIHKETTAINKAIVKKDSLYDLKGKQNQNKTNLESNRISVATTSTTKPTTIESKTTKASVSPSAIRRIFTDVTGRSITSVTTVASLPGLSSHIPAPRTDDYSIPRPNEGGLDQYDGLDFGYGGYNDMRRFGPAALDLFQQYDMNVNSTLNVGDAAGNQTLDVYGELMKKTQLDQNLYDYGLKNVSQKEYHPFARSPGFIRPPVFDDPVLL